jgi:CheY-like chemotaxis protein
MKILVIDDKKENRDAALEQLKDHNVTVAGTYDEAQSLLQKKHNFEVVLADLMMPPSKQSLGPKGIQYLNQEMPMGIFLALLAAMNGAKYVAVFTDANHHDHPASAAFDKFAAPDEELTTDGHYPRPLMIEGAKVIFSNKPHWLVREWEDNELTTKSKNWFKVFTYLVHGIKSK